MDWITRRIIYVLGSLLGIAIVALGFAPPEVVEQNSDSIMQAAGGLMALGLSLAAKFTDEASDRHAKAKAKSEEIRTAVPTLSYDDLAVQTDRSINSRPTVQKLLAESKPKDYPY